MKLATKIYAAFGALLAVCAFMGLFLMLQINSIGQTFVEYRTAARATMSFNQIAEKASDMRNAALRWRLSQSTEWADRVRANAEATSAAVATARTRVTRPETLTELQAITDGVRTYISAFDTLVAATQRGATAAATEASQQMDRIGPELNTRLNRLTGFYENRQNELGPMAQASVEAANVWGMVLMAAGLLLGAIIAFVMGRWLSSMLVRMTAAMNGLAAGNLAVEIPAVGRKDELGQMASAVQVFKENAIAKEQLERDADMQKLRSEEEKRAAMNALASSFEASVNGVVQSVSAASQQMLSIARAMTHSARTASERATAVAAASEEATVNVQTVAAASEEMSQSIAEVSSRVSNAAELTSRAAHEAVQATEKVGKLSDSAQTIGEVIKLISAIADQTNLLALNATIEAARAGEAGKGFAVVASEVKNLANQTAKATDQIAAQITRMQDDTAGVVSAIDQIGRAIETLNQSAASIAAAVEEQHAATTEIARNTNQAADGTREVSSNITDVSASVGETGAAADQVLSAAQALSQQAEVLRGEVSGFLQRVRAA